MFMIRRICLVSVATSKPKTLAVPSLGRSSVVRILMSVVLPAPFGPSRPKNSPGSTVEVDAVEGDDGLSA